MPLIGRRRRNYDRTRRYGNWRQLYYNADGMCELCQDVHNLEIHEETDGATYITYHLVCDKCHIEVIHKDESASNLSPKNRKYQSQLSRDISDEIEECGGLDNWKKKYFIKEMNEKTICTRIPLE